jgi:hypothetical protein
MPYITAVTESTLAYLAESTAYTLIVWVIELFDKFLIVFVLLATDAIFFVGFHERIRPPTLYRLSKTHRP